MGPHHFRSNGRLAEPGPLRSPHDNYRDSGRLTLRQLCRRCQLVDYAHFRHDQLATRSVLRPPEVNYGRNTRTPDGHVGQAGAPRATECVGDDHRHLDTCPSAEGIAYVPGAAVRVDREQGGLAGGDV